MAILEKPFHRGGGKFLLVFKSMKCVKTKLGTWDVLEEETPISSCGYFSKCLLGLFGACGSFRFSPLFSPC